MTLPPLPNPFFGVTGFIRLNVPHAPAFASYQMADYGQQCYEAGRASIREEAAELSEGHFGDGFRLAEEIRSLK